MQSVLEWLYTQTTGDTCLPSCLVTILSKRGIVKPSQELELEILVEGGKLRSKENRTFSHLVYVCKKFDLSACYYTSSDYMKKIADEMREDMKMDKIKIEKEVINTEKVEELLLDGDVIISIDDYGLRKEVHFPHFLVVDRFDNGKFYILDVWEGQEVAISKRQLDHAISLLDKLYYCREAVVLV